MQEEASEFAAFIGIDWADRKHDVCLQVSGADTIEVSVVEHRPKAIEEWAHKLRERFAGSESQCASSFPTDRSFRRSSNMTSS
jgi:hypothetical protein